MTKKESWKGQLRDMVIAIMIIITSFWLMFNVLLPGATWIMDTLFANDMVTSTYTNAEPYLGNQLVFPEGWTLSLYVTSGGSDGRYICERDGVYRVCVPRVEPME